jgi:CHASE2 domain-containing sensor protein
MLHAIGYQASRGSFQSIWHTLGAPALQPLGEAAAAALLVAATIVARRDPARVRDPRRMAALAAAVLIAVQLAASYWAFLYLAWIAPLVLAALVFPAGARTARSAT